MKRVKQDNIVCEKSPSKMERSVIEIPDPKDNNRDLVKLLTIFPVEIWNLAGEYVDRQEDLDNLWKASTAFRNVIVPNRVLALFPKVWQVMAKKYHTQRHDSSYNDVCSSNYNDNPNSGRRDVRWYSGVLKLRLVCKTWRNTIDMFYQNPDHHLKMKQDPVHEFNYLDLWTHDGFSEDSKELKAFVKHFSNSHGSGITATNPFLGRQVHLHLEVEACSNGGQSTCRVIDALKRYGNHIWYCNIFIASRKTNDCVVYGILKNWLQEMPNLKSLCISYLKLLTYRTNELENEVKANPLPKLDNLEFLRTHDLPAPMLNEILRSISHISILEFSKFNGILDSQIFPVALTNLRQLAIEICSQEEFQWFKSASQMLPLTKLHLVFGERAFVECSQVFAWLEENWSDSLVDLVLHFPHTSRIVEADSLLLNLTQVKRLKLTLNGITSLDFLLPMKDTLEHLEIGRNCNGQGMAELLEGRQLNPMDDHSAISSNVWTIFPKLSHLLVTRNKYARHCFTRRQWKSTIVNPRR